MVPPLSIPISTLVVVYVPSEFFGVDKLSNLTSAAWFVFTLPFWCSTDAGLWHWPQPNIYVVEFEWLPVVFAVGILTEL